jgi:hypothetical protein
MKKVIMRKAINNLIILCITFFFYSCQVYKEKITDSFFLKWEIESNKRLNKKLKSPLEKEVLELSTLINCKDLFQGERFPNLKYNIINENIKVSIVEDLDCPEFKKFPPKFSLKTPVYIFKDSVFKNGGSCSKTNQQLLILTDFYKDKVYGKLKYGFGSRNEGKKLKTARAILERYSGNFYKIPEKTVNMIFNKSIDTVIVDIARTYGMNKKRFIKIDNKWVFDEILLKFSE